MTINRYEDIKNRIDFIYPVKIREQKEILRKFWKDFKDEVSHLEEIVKKDFAEAIKDVDLNGAEILDYNVKYILKSRCWKVKITKFRFPDGVITEDSNPPSLTENCPHTYLEPVGGYLSKDDIHPKITEFMKRYVIKRIRGPNHLCGHK